MTASASSGGLSERTSEKLSDRASDKAEAARQSVNKVFNKLLHPLSKGAKHHPDNNSEAQSPISCISSELTTAEDLIQQMGWLASHSYLRIIVREAHNLAVTEADTTDPFVKVTFGEDNGLVDDATRVCYRNTEPFWEESLMFPIQGKSHDTMVRLAVFDKGVMKSIFMGQVTTTLGALLSQVKQVNEEVVHWMPLQKRGSERKSSDVVGGELCFSVSVLDHGLYLQQYRDAQQLLDPVSLNSRLGSMVLQVTLHDIKRLQQAEGRLIGPLTLEIRIARSAVRFPIIHQEVLAGDGMSKTTVSTLASTIVIPLSRAFRNRGAVIIPAATDENSKHMAAARAFQAFTNGMVEGGLMATVPLKRSKDRHEVADVKLYIRSGRDVIAKTQIPIWTVPNKADEVASALEAQLSAASVLASATSAGSSISNAKSAKTPFEKLMQAPSSLPAALVSALTASPPKLSEKLEPMLSRGSHPSLLSVVEASCTGRRFTRVMEHYRKELGPKRLELSVSLQLRPKDCASGAAVETVEDSEDEEDISAPAAPFMPPSDLDTPVADSVLGCGPNKLYRILWKADSDTVKKVQDSEKLKDITMTPWVLDPASKTKSRTTTYIKQLNLNIPFVPKEALCTSLVTVQLKEDGGWCVTQKIQTKAPQGDAFYVMMQWVATHVSATKTRLKVSMHVEFLRNVMTKGIITSQSVADSKRYLVLVLGIVREQVGDPASGALGVASDAASVMVAPVIQESAFRVSAVQLVQLALLALVALAIWRLSSTTARSADRMVRALTDLAEAVRSGSPPGAAAHLGTDQLRELLASVAQQAVPAAPLHVEL